MPQLSAAISFSRIERIARPWRDFMTMWITRQVITTQMNTFETVAALGMRLRPEAPKVKSKPSTLSMLRSTTRMISPKPRVMIAR